MSRLGKTFLLMAGLALLATSTPAHAQLVGDEYSGWFPSQATRNVPAGTVQDPGSQLLYIVDTGINLRAEFGADLSDPAFDQPLSADPVFGVGGTRSIYDAAGNPMQGVATMKNFISITNTHPTQAVTVHFRYFNDECVDVLDFLVLLTCNDTLIFDPFDFIIPGTNFNSQWRIFGPAVGVIGPIPRREFASGRFMIFAMASGTSTNTNDNTTGTDGFIFPREFRGTFQDDDSHCINLRDEDNFGTQNGINASNLHVFNASAVAFNYLIGTFTTAVPGGLITDPLAPDVPQFLAYGVNAWARPAVDIETQSFSPRTGSFNGDGWPLTGDFFNFRILTGSEPVRQANGVGLVNINSLYLRNEVHGGDTRGTGPFDASPENGDLWGFDGSRSYYGALAWASLMGAAPQNQLVHLFSAVDDYDGSRHALDEPITGFVDRSYNLNGARTTYLLQMYDNAENLFFLDEDAPINISPPPPIDIAELRITVECLRVWLTSLRDPLTSVDDLSIADLDGLAAGVLAHLTKPVDVQQDASQGWIRFVRDNTHGGTRGVGPIDETPEIQNNAGQASFVTIGLAVVKFEGFGAAWWLNTSAYDIRVSETGEVALDPIDPGANNND